MLGQPRTTQRRARKVASDEGALRGDIVRLASRFGRYGYRRVTDMLRIEGVMDRLAKFAQRRPGPRPRRHLTRGRDVLQVVIRSTKAGAETPATRRCAPPQCPKAAPLNEGRGRDPGDTRLLSPLPPVTQVAQRRPGPRPRRHGKNPTT